MCLQTPPPLLFLFSHRTFILIGRFRAQPCWSSVSAFTLFFTLAAWLRTAQCLMVRKRPLWTANPRSSAPERVWTHCGYRGSPIIKWPSCWEPSGAMRGRGKWSTSWRWTPTLYADARWVSKRSSRLSFCVYESLRKRYFCTVWGLLLLDSFNEVKAEGIICKSRMTCLTMTQNKVSCIVCHRHLLLEVM